MFKMFHCVCVCVLSTFMSVYSSHGGQKGASDPLKLNVQMVACEC